MNQSHSECLDHQHAPAGARDEDRVSLQDCLNELLYFRLPYAADQCRDLPRYD